MNAKLADGGAALPAWWLLGILCVASATMLLLLGSSFTFYSDEWVVVLLRPGFSADTILGPHNEHLVALPIVAYKALIAAFGLESQFPHRLLLVSSVLALAAVVFAYVRERAGNVLALLAAAMLLFLGPAWEDLLWPFQVAFMGALAAGVGALLALERDTPPRNLLAALLLVLSISISDLGLPFLLAATIIVLLRRRPIQLWIPGISGILFAAWWLSYGHEASSNVSLSNVARSPAYVLDSISNGLASIAGMGRPLASPADAFPWGRPLLVLAVAATCIWLLRGGRPSSRVLAVAAAGMTFWFLTAASYIPGREPQVSRYQLVTCTFLILIAAEFFRPVRIGPAGLGLISAIALMAIGSNLGELREGYRFMEARSTYAKASLGALEIGRARFPAELQLVESISRDPALAGVFAGAYYERTDEDGPLPVYDPREIAAASPEVRQAVDSILAAGYALHLAPVRGAALRRGADCLRLAPRFDGRPRELIVSPGNVLITSLGSGPVDIGVRRFAPSGLSFSLGGLAGNRSALIRIPPDRVGRTWYLRASGDSPLDVCALPTSFES
jgi:hypothetical protein